MEGWVIEQLEWEVGEEEAQAVLKLVIPELRKDVLKEVGEYLEAQYEKDYGYGYLSSDNRWLFIARLKVGMLP